MYSFDLYQFVKDFQKANSKEAQGELIARTIAESRNFDLSKLTTKDQLELARQDLKHDISSAGQELDSLR